LALLPVGFAEPACRQAAGGLLPRHFTLTLLVIRRQWPAERHRYGSSRWPRIRSQQGGIFLLHYPYPRPSLSGQPWTVDVIHHRVLWSPDFPLSGAASRDARGHRTATVQPTRGFSSILSGFSLTSAMVVLYW